MPARTITDLPEELIETILGHVKDHASPEQFWNCLKVSSQMHRIGLGVYNGLGFSATAVIESDIRCGDEREPGIGSDTCLKVEFNPLSPSKLYMSLLKSLTIHVQHRRIAAESSPSANIDLVKSIQGVFEIATTLSTFSLTFADGWDFPSKDVPAVPQSLLARLVAALPPTVTNLELDTAGIDVFPDEETLHSSEEFHLCYQIRRILLRLVHLRLRVGHVCKSLLDVQPNALRCDVEHCGLCTINEQATCELVSSWQMRSFIIWLPIEQDEGNNSLVQASQALLNPSLENDAIVLFVFQYEDEEWDPIAPYPSFAWKPQSNLSSSLQGELVSPGFTPVQGDSRNYPGSLVKHVSRAKHISAGSCSEDDIMLSYKERRYFFMTARLVDKPSICNYPYVAEHAVQGTLSWSQNTHLGYRYPMPLADKPSKPFWKGENIWACRFPGCTARTNELSRLRKHVASAHPVNPHIGIWKGLEPCPSLGCDRVGEYGFKGRRQEWEDHLLQHHSRPCPLVSGSSTLNLRPALSQ